MNGLTLDEPEDQTGLAHASSPEHNDPIIIALLGHLDSTLPLSRALGAAVCFRFRRNFERPMVGGFKRRTVRRDEKIGMRSDELG